MCKYRIEVVKPPVGNRAGECTLSAIEGENVIGITQVKYWPSAAFASELHVGATAKATFQTVAGKPRNDGTNWPDEEFLKSWGDTEEKPKGKRGGYRSFEPPRIAVSASRKVNLGNFESADLHITYSNIPFDVDQATMDQIRATAEKIVIPAVLDDLRRKIKEIRIEGQPEQKKVSA